MRLLSTADWLSIRERAALPEFRLAVDRLHQEAASFMMQPLAVQREPGGYYHDYFCPTHGAQLLFDPASPTAHRCPVDGAIWQGAPFDAAWRWFVNNRLSEAAIRLALAWRLDGNDRYLQQVTQLLDDYADQYASYQTVPPSVRNPSVRNSGVATYTTLDESVWILPLTWAFDIIRQDLEPAQIDHISRRLFAPVAEHLISHHFGGVHNFACWHNAAIGTIGVVLDRADWIHFAIDGEFGANTQIQAGVLADGLWFEGSFSYHFYTLAALLALAKATRHLPGFALHERAELCIMFLAPIHSAYPDWSLPATNDCWYFAGLLANCCHGVPPAPAFYEIAYRWYGDPLFAQLLQRAYRQTARDSLDALLFGQPLLPSASLPPQPSANLPASGYAILRSMATEGKAPPDQESHQRYLLLKYGPHGAGHGHPDKLNLILHAYGERLSPDFGSPGYGLDLFESWYRQTISHNTVTLDGRSQPPATGRLHHFRTDGDFQVADASVAWPEDRPEDRSEDRSGTAIAPPYRNSWMRRVILARPNYFLDILLVMSEEPTRIDWIYHNRGTPLVTLAGQAVVMSSEDGAGYQHISRAHRSSANDDFVVTWQPPIGGPVTAGLKLFVAGGIAGEAITGLIPGNPPTSQYGLLIHRRQATTTAFLSLFHPYQSVPQVTSVEWLGRKLVEDGWAGCVVHCRDHQGQYHQEQWLIRLSSTAMRSLPSSPPQAALRFDYLLNPS